MARMDELNLKNLKKQLSERGVFYTDTALARMLRSFMPEGLTEVYDPTCGCGNLLAVFGDDVVKYGQEIDPGQAAIAQRLPNARIAVGDTLQEPAFTDKRFKGIVANPPFGIRWEPLPHDARFSVAPATAPPSKADYAFILHCLSLLADDGVMAALGWPGILYRGQREGTIRRWLVEQGYIHQVVAIEGGHFIDTKASTCLLVIKKVRADVITFTDNATGRSRNVGLQEIAANDYNLSANLYIHDEAPDRFAGFDPTAAETAARTHALKRIKAEIEFSLMVSKFEGFDIEPFLDDIMALANSYKRQPSLLF